MAEPLLIASRDNALVKQLRKLGTDNTAYRKQGQFWVEGEHLCAAALARGAVPVMAIFSQSFWPLARAEYRQSAIKNIVLPDAVFRDLSGLESPAHLGFVMELAHAVQVQPLAASVVLDRVQDAGNVGSILRSAAAFGFRQVLALKGSAALWSPKVLRAGMGAHFGLNLVEGLALEDLGSLQVPLVVSSSHRGTLIQHAQLPVPCAWVLGHEGQGVCQELMDRAALFVRIGQPGGEESLNVAAAAAICLHASSLESPGTAPQ